VLACGLRNLKQVYVAGELVVNGVTLTQQDEPTIRREVDARMARLVATAAKAAEQKLHLNK